MPLPCHTDHSQLTAAANLLLNRLKGELTPNLLDCFALSAIIDIMDTLTMDQHEDLPFSPVSNFGCRMDTK